MGAHFTAGSAPSILSLVQDQTLAAPAASISFTGLSLETDNNYILKAMLLSAVDGGQVLRATCNNDTTANNYLYQTLLAQLAGVVAAPAAGTHDSIIGAMGDKSAGGVHGLTMLELRIKKLASNSAIIQSEAAVYHPLGATPSIDIYTANVLWLTTANVTRLDIVSDTAGGLAAGSKATLYKVI